MRILAVDDDQVALDLLSLVLRQSGHEDVSVATSGHSALEAMRESETPFDCLIFDIEMPGMNGIDLCKSVRAIPEHLDTPIIMLTAKSDALLIESAFIAGANDYITKPFDVNDVSPRLEVAYRMVSQGKRTQHFNPSQNPSMQQAGNHPFEVSEPLHLSRSSQLTDPFSLGNYLLQLDKKRIESSLVFAVQLDHTQSLYDSCTSFEFGTVLKNISQAISSVFDNSRMLCAYMGDGTFMCVSNENILHLWPEIESEFGYVLNAMDETPSPTKQIGISLTVGRPVRPNSSKTKRVRPTFDRAMAALDRRKDVKAAELAIEVEKLSMKLKT